MRFCTTTICKQVREQLREHEKDHVTDQVIGQVTGQVTGQVRRLIQIVRGDTKSRDEIMHLLGLKGRDNFRVNYLVPALDAGLLAMLYPNKPNSPDKAYYLTPKGLELLTKINTNNSNN